MAWRGALQAAQGQRPSRRDLLLTPQNATRIADSLACMRGAAMKVGQLVSMETGEVLPPEIAEILARLRDQADFMPPRQLKTVLAAEWGRDFLRQFAHFDVRPVAAASIGQVHRARTRDGRDLAIKVQYPGVRASIDSDVDNVASLIRMSGLLPDGFDMAPLLAEAKRELHQEADYRHEGRCLESFAALLGDDAAFRVPSLQPDLTTPKILAMTYLPGEPVDALAAAPQAERDRVAACLIALTLREIFTFGLMQTDPNFANYRYDPQSGAIILLDFGATRALAPETAAAYRRVLDAGLRADADGLHEAALTAGFYDATAPGRYQAAILEMIEIAIEPLRQFAPFDFAGSEVAERLRAAGNELAYRGDHAHLPPMDTLFVQRKVGGMFLLGSRLRARVPLRALLEEVLAAQC
jgi:predicted unusual protein kinase regulating ubiquinone biosynthesis (AarF/ABC1/UbiB family)